MLKDDNLIGFLAIDAKDAGWGLLHGAPQNRCFIHALGFFCTFLVAV